MKKILFIFLGIILVGALSWFGYKKFFHKTKTIPNLSTSTSESTETPQKGLKYRNFDLKIKINWQVNPQKAPANPVVSSGEIITTFYFPVEGGAAMKNYGWATITDYRTKDTNTICKLNEGTTNDSVSFDAYFDNKNTIKIKKVSYQSKTLKCTMDMPEPVPDVPTTDEKVYSRLLGAFDEREFELDISPSAQNSFTNISYDDGWHLADITFEIKDNGIVTYE